MTKIQQLDRSSVVPLYYQIQQRLLSQIQSGEFDAEKPLPSVQEIAASLGVSHMTARQAIKSLCDLGVLYSKPGRGTFVSGIKLEEGFSPGTVLHGRNESPRLEASQQGALI